MIRNRFISTGILKIVCFLFNLLFVFCSTCCLFSGGCRSSNQALARSKIIFVASSCQVGQATSPLPLPLCFRPSVRHTPRLGAQRWDGARNKATNMQHLLNVHLRVRGDYPSNLFLRWRLSPDRPQDCDTISKSIIVQILCWICATLDVKKSRTETTNATAKS